MELRVICRIAISGLTAFALMGSAMLSGAAVYLIPHLVEGRPGS
jgi:hypothetical protein